MKAMLVIVEGRATRKEVSLPLPAKIGRSRNSDLTVDHPTVSRSHCELFERGGTVMVRDAGSSNGTFVDGHQVSTAELKPGDKLTIGPLTFQLVLKPADNGESPSRMGTQDTVAVAGSTVDTTEVAHEPAVTQELDLDALPDVGEEAQELEPLSSTDEPVAESAGEIELADFEGPAPSTEESLDSEPLSISDNAEAEPSAELELPDFEQEERHEASSEPALELETLEADDVSFELARPSTEPDGKTADRAEESASLEPLTADDEASLELLPEIDEAAKPAADGPAGGSTGGTLTDEELDNFLSELD